MFAGLVFCIIVFGAIVAPTVRHWRRRDRQQLAASALLVLIYSTLLLHTHEPTSCLVLYLRTHTHSHTHTLSWAHRLPRPGGKPWGQALPGSPGKADTPKRQLFRIAVHCWPPPSAHSIYLLRWMGS